MKKLAKIASVSLLATIMASVLLWQGCKKNEVEDLVNSQNPSTKTNMNGSNFDPQGNGAHLFPSDQQAEQQIIEFGKFLRNEVTAEQYGSKDLDVANFILNYAGILRFALPEDEDSVIGLTHIDSINIPITLANGKVTPANLKSAWNQLGTFVTTLMSYDGTISNVSTISDAVAILGPRPLVLTINGQIVDNSTLKFYVVCCGAKTNKVTGDCNCYLPESLWTQMHYPGPAPTGVKALDDELTIRINNSLHNKDCFPKQCPKVPVGFRNVCESCTTIYKNSDEATNYNWYKTPTPDNANSLYLTMTRGCEIRSEIIRYIKDNMPNNCTCVISVNVKR